MKLPAFQMHRPASVEEAVVLRHELGDDAAFYCGGSELLLVMKLGMTDLGHLIDVKGVDSLRSITFTEGSLRIGATATHREIENHPLVLEHAPAFAEMISGIANVRVRSVGTLGGNLAFADPASDPATFLTAVGAELEISGPGGSQRTVPVAELGVGAYQTVLGEDELIEAVIVPATKSGEATVHQRMKFKERPAITVTVSTRVEAGVVVAARVSVGAVSAVPARLLAAEEALQGADQESVLGAAANAGDAAANLVRLLDDSDENLLYKRQLTRVLVGRSAVKAMESAIAM